MKKYVKDGKQVSYGFANHQMNQQLKSLGHKVVQDKKKKASKTACRRKEKIW